MSSVLGGWRRASVFANPLCLLSNHFKTMWTSPHFWAFVRATAICHSPPLLICWMDYHLYFRFRSYLSFFLKALPYPGPHPLSQAERGALGTSPHSHNALHVWPYLFLWLAPGLVSPLSPQTFWTLSQGPTILRGAYPMAGVQRLSGFINTNLLSPAVNIKQTPKEADDANMWMGIMVLGDGKGHWGHDVLTCRRRFSVLSLVQKVLKKGDYKTGQLGVSNSHDNDYSFFPPQVLYFSKSNIVCSRG